ncbi:MAG: FtsX-like permease family protein [Saprospiraceae bacterium]
MLKNHFKIAFRNFWNHKLFSFINIFGLSIGISTALVIYLIVQYEFSFDRFHEDKDRIYRIYSKIEHPDLILLNSGVPFPAAKAIRDEVSGLEKVTHFIANYDLKVAIPISNQLSPVVYAKQKDIIYTDDDYFSIFQYHWLAGSVQSALQDPFRVVLTESRAKIYFPNLSYQEVLGRRVIYNDSLQALISGIVRDFDRPTDFNFKEFISKVTIENKKIRGQWNWDDWGSINSSSQLFVKLNAGVNPGLIKTQLDEVAKKYKEEDVTQFLQPLKTLHFNSDLNAFDNRQASRPTLIGLLLVAAFILLLGCINFINLATARSVYRAKEIGIRKTIGSGKSQLLFQFLSETFALTLIATLISLVIAPWLLNIFRDFIPPGVSFKSINQPHVWFFLIALVLIVSILAGLYPAMILARFKPVTVLKNQTISGDGQSRKAWLRQTLTVTQFVITQVILISTLILAKQINYSLHKDLGYKKDAIVFLNTERDIFLNEKDTRRFVLMERLKSLPDIEQISLGSAPPASSKYNVRTLKFLKGDQIVETNVETKTADLEYFDLYKMKMIAGRNFLPSDTVKEFIINETYANVLGFTNPVDALGKLIEQRRKKYPIVGVLADFQVKSTHDPIKPLAYTSDLANSYTIHMALRPRGNDPLAWQKVLDKTAKIYKEIYPSDEFKYTFFDESIAEFYKPEQDMIRLLKWAAGICILISCLGLLGLVIHVTTQRTKEIGVRKILGASVGQLVTLLSKDFIALVIIAFIIAAPIAWWALHRWLADFAYRVDIGWFVFAVVGIAAVLIAMLTVSYQAIRTAVMSPVTSLRHE